MINIIIRFRKEPLQTITGFNSGFNSIVADTTLIMDDFLQLGSVFKHVGNAKRGR
jgi:hypothetical protein